MEQGVIMLDPEQLAEKLNVPASWVYARTRRGRRSEIPHVRFGRYVRFAWGSTEMEDWLKGLTVRGRRQ